MAQLNDIYKLDAAADAETKRELAGELMKLEQESADRPAEQFVILRTAARLAGEGGDAKTTLAAVKAMADGFQVDALDVTTEALERLGAFQRMGPERRCPARCGRQPLRGQVHPGTPPPGRREGQLRGGWLRGPGGRFSQDSLQGCPIQAGDNPERPSCGRNGPWSADLVAIPHRGGEFR